MNTLPNAAALLAVCLLTASGVAYAAPGESPPTPQPVEDRESFTVEAGAITLGSDGRICAEKRAPNVNRVTITNATLEDVTIYLESGGVSQRVAMDTVDAEGSIVMYTNGENAKVDLLASVGACVPLDQTHTVVEVFYMRSDALTGSGTSLVAGANGSAVPEPGGFDVGSLAANNSTSPGGPTDATVPIANGTDAVDDRVDGAADAVGGAVGNATGTVDETVNGTPAGIGGTVENSTGTVERTVENSTETVEATADAVSNSTDDAAETVNSTVDETTDTVDGATGGAANGTTETVDGTVEGTAGTVTNATDSTTETATNVTDSTTETVDSTATTVTNTTEAVTNTTEAVTNVTNETTDGAVSTTETVTSSTDELTSTDETAETATNTTEGTTETVTNATDGTAETATNTTEGTTETTATDDGGSLLGLFGLRVGR